LAFCTNCGAALPDVGAKYCPACGAPVLSSTGKKSEAAHKVFEIQGIPKVAVTVRTPGSIDVTKGTAGQVVVDADIMEPENIEYHVSQNVNEVVVSARARSWNPLLWGSYVFSGGPRTNIRVALPPEANLDLETVTDSISVSGVIGTISAESKTGPIRFRECGGTISVKTHTGNVDLDGVNALVDIRDTIGHVSFAGSLSNGENSFRTTTGDIDIALKGQPDLKVDASTTVGHIICRLDMTEARYDRGQYVGQHVSGRIGSGTGKLNLEATTGSISIIKQ
jgi:hypothetical protein